MKPEEYENDITEEQARLRKRLMILSERINTDIYEHRKRLLGKVLTIVDSAFTDPEQRKAVKDLIQDAWYQGSYWNYIAGQFNLLADAEGLGDLASGSGQVPSAADKDYSYHHLQ